MGKKKPTMLIKLITNIFKGMLKKKLTCYINVDKVSFSQKKNKYYYFMFIKNTNPHFINRVYIKKNE